MKKKNILSKSSALFLSMILLLGGCGTSGEEDSNVSSGTVPSVLSDPSESSTESSIEAPSPETTASSDELATDPESRALTITITNMCGADIGMFSVIDPLSGEQVNVDSLANGESLTLTADWPSSVENFDWALYNQDGNLCVESTTDISSANSSVTLTLTGDGNFEGVEEAFE